MLAARRCLPGSRGVRPRAACRSRVAPVVVCRADGQQRAQQPAPLVGDLQQRLARVLASAGHLAVAASLALSPLAAADEGGGGSVLLRLPASDIPEVYATQQTMLEAWSIVGDTFVDEDFNGHWWPDELRAHMVAAYGARDGAGAYAEIGGMLAALGDPYTRIIPPSEYADFRVSSEGELQGVGLLIANEPVNNHLLVLSAIKGGPADRAGITSGDEVISINDQPTDGWTGDMAAKLLRGKGGTEVRVKLARRTSGIPGVPGRPEPRLPDDDDATVREVRLRREKLALSPLYWTALQAQAPAPTPAGAPRGFTLASAPPLAGGGPAAAARAAAASAEPGVHRLLSTAVTAGGWDRDGPGGGDASGSGERWGYMRLTSFSQNTAEEARRAITDLEAKGVSGYILDLRDNPGGLVKAGLDLARLLMDGHPTVFSIVGRPGEPAQQVALGEDGDDSGPVEALTHRPLVVLVNEHSASASEILSGALHDNGRATLIGDAPTYGKGRIQSVYELHDGSALFVTVAKYVTPAGTVIDQRGLRPDLACGLDAGGGAGGGFDDAGGGLLGVRSGAPGAAAGGASSRGGGAAPGGGGAAPGGVAAAFIPGLPVGAGSDDALVAALSADRCVLTAAAVLHDKAAVVSATARVAASLPAQL